MKLHTVLISYNRRDLTEQALNTYLATVSVPYTLVVVDNGSDKETTTWLRDELISRRDKNFWLLPLLENRYPGYACNRGFEQAPDDATHLHRADNDFAFLPGWCSRVAAAFRDKKVGQVGLRTDEEELNAPWNVGGNMVIRRELWDAGLRYDERPWPEYPPGYSEDSYYSPQVEKMGWRWRRVKRPCIRSLATGDLNDPYYQQSYSERGILTEAIADIQQRQALGIREDV